MLIYFFSDRNYLRPGFQAVFKTGQCPFNCTDGICNSNTHSCSCSSHSIGDYCQHVSAGYTHYLTHFGCVFSKIFLCLELIYYWCLSCIRISFRSYFFFVHLLYVFSPFIRTTVVLMAKQRMRQLAVFATKVGQATGATFHSHQLLRHRPLILIT